MHALSLLALLLPLAAANNHLQCDCMSWNQGENWVHNAMLTQWVCWSFYQNQAIYDSRQGRCVATPGNKIGGEPWEKHCKDSGASGYYPIESDSYGNETPNTSQPARRIGAAAGSCPDRVD
ncbi:hypothetical protein E4U58_007600 [Claviceps cyperi]|nr:hypothetical protein E4U58_007600 [Claviceps cyperi]